MRISQTRAVTFPQIGNENAEIPKWNGLFSYSKEAMRKLRLNEYTLHNKAEFLNKKIQLITFTFPLDWNNEKRAKQIKVLVNRLKKVFPFGGMWWIELHTKESKGLYHMHMKVLTNTPVYEIILYLQKIAKKDTGNKYGYDISKNEKTKIYSFIYSDDTEKKDQFDIKNVSHRLNGYWNLDRTPEITNDINQITPFKVSKSGLIITKRNNHGFRINKSKNNG